LSTFVTQIVNGYNWMVRGDSQTLEYPFRFNYPQQLFKPVPHESENFRIV